ncbi:MAG: ferredoxin [Candidatus Pacebacteria bacterium]|jgi:ferredoxin|nr:ferredoxin [Candidatus Paceibacterota bacterium]
MAKVILERDKCIGCGACEAVCPKHWKLGEDGKTDLLGSKKEDNENYVLEAEEAGCNNQAAEACPVQCIRVE